METHRPMLNLNKMYDKYTKCKKNFKKYLDEMEATVEAIDFFPKANVSILQDQRHALRFYVDFNILDLVLVSTKYRSESNEELSIISLVKSLILLSVDVEFHFHKLRPFSLIFCISPCFLSRFCNCLIPSILGIPVVLLFCL